MEKEVTFPYLESPDEWKISKHLPEVCFWKGNYVIRRIGSASTRAMVFQVVIDGKNMACKILIDTESNPTERNKAETEVSKYLGDKYPDYFPKIYFVGYCDNIKIPPGIVNENLIKEGILYQLILRTKNEPKIVQKKLSVRYRNGYDLRVYLDHLGIKDVSEIKIPVMLMFSELGHEDLNSWAGRPHTSEEYRNMIKHILEGIEILASEGISHRDLHLGNVVIFLNSTGKETFKIIDFGEHLRTPDPRFDTEKFLDSLLKIPSLPQDVRIEIQSLIM